MAPEDFKPDYLLPGTRVGAYVVRALLEQGGSSSVYEVEGEEGHRFALKLCRYHSGAYGTSEWRMDQRYSRSISCLQLLKGQRNVAELYAHGRYPDPLRGHQYLVHELVPGGLLITEWVKTRESPTLRKLVGAFAELAELCGVMASKGICHRDLKPGNILVTPDGTPKVIDFESATCPHTKPVTRREAGEVPGTRGWQCPELCQAILDEQSNKKSKEAFEFHPWGDLFSLGVVLYECLTGEHPFDTSLPHRLLLAEIAYETPIHPMQLSTAVPLGMDKVVMGMLEKQPEARYRDGAEVAAGAQPADLPPGAPPRAWLAASACTSCRRSSASSRPTAPAGTSGGTRNSAAAAALSWPSSLDRCRGTAPTGTSRLHPARRLRPRGGSPDRREVDLAQAAAKAAAA